MNMNGMSMSGMSMSGMSMSGMTTKTSTGMSMPSSTASSMHMSNMHMSNMHMSNMPMSTFVIERLVQPTSVSGSMTMTGGMPMSTSPVMTIVGDVMAMKGNMNMNDSMSMSGGMMNMGGMNMGDDSMLMHSWLSPTYRDYPVLFKGLHANTAGKQFGIFLLMVVGAFVYKFITYVSWCLEVHWFKKWSKSKAPADAKNTLAQGLGDDEAALGPLPKVPNFMFDLFWPSWVDLFHDFIRAILAFCSTMLVYMLMLAAMSFVLTYVFAAITGLALAEVFFNRCKICTMRRWEIKRQISDYRNCPGYGNCQCGRHSGPPSDDSGAPSANGDAGEKMSSRQISRLQSNDVSTTGLPEDDAPEDCCCDDGGRREREAEAQLENVISENARWNEQAGMMDTNFLPAERLR